ncbi:MAG TPA: alpha/beta hydrolase [Thermoanaerobaculia bacterium]|nr:alpha/beta hydrolase [Thermoanaerobaculia bacterium]
MRSRYLANPPARSRPRAESWRAALAAGGAAALLLTACAALRPFAEVRREQPDNRFVEVDGRQVYVEQQGAGDPVVLLHGFGESSYTWRRVMPELARSFRVVAPDLNGFGWTERPHDPQSYTPLGQERLVLGVLAALGIGRAQFVGHSYGGSLTLFLASRHPELVRAMVLVDSAAPTYAEDRRSRLAALRPLDQLFVRLALRPRRIRGSLLASVYDPAVVTPALVRAYLDRLRVEGEVDAYYGLTAPLPRPAAGAAAAGGGVKLERIAVPALVVWGAEDRLIRVEAGRRAAGKLPAGEFVTIPRAGHLPMEERPAELLGLMVPFLKRHAEAGGTASLAPGASASSPRVPRGRG